MTEVPPFPSPVRNYHRDTYPAIDPTSPRLSTAGKNIVITGAGQGIGRETALSFAKSGASSINIFGRTEKTLLNTKAEINASYPNSKVYTYPVDITDKPALVEAFAKIKEVAGPIDVLVACAGYLSRLQPIAAAENNFDDWWKGYEINVKGNFNLVTAFFPVAAKNASIIYLSTGIVQLPYAPGYSGYATSKLAATKFFEYVSHEHPELFVLSVHPGVLGTEMSEKAMRDGGPKWPEDGIALPADFVNWAVSDEAKFLKGKLVWAHWDVEELIAMKGEIEGTDKFTLGLLGWP